LPHARCRRSLPSDDKNLFTASNFFGLRDFAIDLAFFQADDVRFQPIGQRFIKLWDCDEAFDLCPLCCDCVWRSESADTCLAAIAGTYASADMARGRA
jgi:hypothetical protein